MKSYKTNAICNSHPKKLTSLVEGISSKMSELNRKSRLKMPKYLQSHSYSTILSITPEQKKEGKLRLSARNTSTKTSSITQKSISEVFASIEFDKIEPKFLEEDEISPFSAEEENSEFNAELIESGCSSFEEESNEDISRKKSLSIYLDRDEFEEDLEINGEILIGKLLKNQDEKIDEGKKIMKKKNLDLKNEKTNYNESDQEEVEEISFVELMKQEGLLEEIKGLVDKEGILSYQDLKEFLIPKRRIPNFKSLYLFRMGERQLLPRGELTDV